MSEQFGPIQELLNRVRARWRRLVLLEVTTRAALAGTVVVGFALVVSRWLAQAPLALALLAGAAVVAGLASIVWAAWPSRQIPSDRSVARYIEERAPALDERLVSAVDVVTSRGADERPALAAAMVRDAAAPAYLSQLIDDCVFNPGVAYCGDGPGACFRFFSLRAASLQNGGDLFDIGASYPAHKRVALTESHPEDYRLSDLGMFIRRAYKRVVWLKRKLDGQPVTRGPLGEITGNRIAG